MDEDGLPPGWAWAKLGDLCDVIGGITVDAKRGGPGMVEVPYLRVANVQRGRLDLRNMRTILVPAARLDHLRLAEGDVLLNEGGDRDKVGRGWVWEGRIDPCVFQNHVFRARPRSQAINPYYLSLYLNECGRAHFLAGAKQTTNLASISLSAVKETPVAVAPKTEQDRIVSVVDDLFAEVEAGEAALARAREALTTFRASLLHAAVTGQLTEAWRAAHPPTEDGPALLRRILAERTAPPRPGTPTAAPGAPFALPDGWTMCCLADLISEGPTNGYSPTVSTDGAGTLSLKLTATTRGVIDLSPRATKQLSETLPSGSSRFLKPGDLLFQRGNTLEYVGISAVFEGPEDTFIYPDLMIRVRAHAYYLTDWLWRVANSPWGRHYLKANASGTAGTMPKITGLTVRQLPIPLPPYIELRTILDEIARSLADIEMAEMIVWRGLREAANLRQSILHAAFTGRLVPQDTADEPAAALLARLRAAPAPPRRTRRRSTEAATA